MVALALCIPGLSQGALATDTAWYTAIAIQAWHGAASGDIGALWTLEGVAGQPYFNKPPLAFWLNGLPLAALGPTVLASRLGSVLACVLCVLAISRLGRLLVGRMVGLSAGLVLALTLEFIRHSHAFSLDLWMTLFVTLAGCSAAAAHAGDQPRRLAFAGIWIGLALLVKPLVPLLAFPLLAAWLPAIGRTRWLGWLAASVAVAAAVAAPWHLSMWFLHGEAFTAQYFGREIIDRAAAGPVADFNKGSASPLYYVPVLLSSYWPWLATLLLAMVALVLREGTPRTRDTLLLAAIWCLGWVALLSIFPDKRPRYLLIAYPIAALASAAMLTRLAPLPVRRFWRTTVRWVPPIAILAAIVIALAPVRLHRPESPQWAALFAWLRDQGNPPLMAGGLAPQRSAQVYLATGRWPIPTRSVSGEPLADPAAGAFVLYHRRDGLSPGPNETVVFTSDSLTVTRLDSPPWTPVPTPDPGE
jgi:4-amino-4-deoxy-L-arabinose transferase-like glycosyltransferase